MKPAVDQSSNILIDYLVDDINQCFALRSHVRIRDVHERRQRLLEELGYKQFH